MTINDCISVFLEAAHDLGADTEVFTDLYGDGEDAYFPAGLTMSEIEDEGKTVLVVNLFGCERD